MQHFSKKRKYKALYLLHYYCFTVDNPLCNIQAVKATKTTSCILNPMDIPGIKTHFLENHLEIICNNVKL